MSIKNNRQSELLAYLEKMPAGQIYLAADKKQILGGFTLCRHVLVKNLCWSDDGSLLTLKILSERYREVGISFDGANLRASCDCSAWSITANCHHVITVLAVLKKALSAESLPFLEIPAEQLMKVRSMLGLQRTLPAESTEKTGSDGMSFPGSPFCLLLEEQSHSLRMTVLRKGVEVSVLTPGLAYPLRLFLQKLSNHQQNTHLFDEFFRHFGKSSRVIFREGARDIPLARDGKISQTLLLQLDSREGEVSIARFLANGRRLDDNFYLSEHFLFNLNEGEYSAIESNAGWHFWNRMVELAGVAQESGEMALLSNSHTMTFDRVFFNKAEFRISESEIKAFLGALRLCQSGKEISPIDSYPSYQLHARGSALDDELIELRAESNCDGIHLYFPPEPFRILSAEGLEGLSVPLRTKKRSAALYEACFMSVGSTGRELAKIVRLCLNSGDFIKRPLRLEFRKIVEEFASEVRQKQFQIIIPKDEWAVVTIDRKVQAELLKIPWELFGPGIFPSALRPGEMIVKKNEFFAALPRLQKRLEESGFALLYRDKPLTSIRWDFVLDASSSSLDWFEIRPEIRCDGAMVGEEEFAQALKNGGFIDKGSTLQFLDSESSRTLVMFAELGQKQKEEVVRIPRLQILDWLMLRKEGLQIRLSAEDERIMESLFSFDKIPSRPLPSALKAELRHYQADGYNWLGFLYEHRFGGCLADDMGLGKTIQAISLLAGLKEGKIAGRHGVEVPHLIIVPPSILFNWESELSRFYPDLKVTLYRGKLRSTDFSGFDIVLTSFEIVRRDIEKLAEIYFHVIIFDEAQSVKNIHSETTSAVRQLRGDFRLALTGTPVENHLGEYCSIIELALPGLLGNLKGFRKKLFLENDNGIKALVRKTKPFVLRRSKQMIVEELPPKIETDIYLDLTSKQKALYGRTVAEVRKTVEDAYREKAPGQARIIALTAILKLRQICLTTRLLLPESDENSPKVDFLMEQLKELIDEGHCVLVFSQFTSFLDILEEELISQRIKFSRLDGSTPVAARKKLVNEFQKGVEPSTFLLSLKAGGRGLNLTRASYVFHLDPWWNPAVENQASDRAHRIGQTSQVNIIRLLMRHTVEEKMMALKEKKLRLYRALLEGAETAGFSVSKEDFYFLLEPLGG